MQKKSALEKTYKTTEKFWTKKTKEAYIKAKKAMIDAFEA